MARKKRSSKARKGSGAKGRPAVLSLGRVASKRGAKARVGKTSKGSARKANVKRAIRGRRY